MLNAGSVVCLHCGRIVKKLYYHNNEMNVWVELKKTATGKYFVKRYKPDNDSADNPDKVTNVKLTPKRIDFKKGIHETIFVDYEYENSPNKGKPFTRSCPYCKETIGGDTVHRIFEGLGTLPTYVIAVIGTTSVGKSCWLGSLCYFGNQIVLNNNNYKIEATKMEGTTSLNIKTGVNSEGKTTVIKILECKNTNEAIEPVANVLVLDVAGELFHEDKQEAFENSHAYTLFAGTEDFTGVDAVVFMDAVDCDENDLTTTYSRVKKLELLNNKPVAYVLNKMDLLFKSPPKIKLDDSSDYSAPILSSSTFRKTGVSYSQKDIVPRIKLETLIASKLRKQAGIIFANNSHSAGFVITTGKPVPGSSDDNKSTTGVSNNVKRYTHDYSDSVNVMDPLVWTLNELGILPIN